MTTTQELTRTYPYGTWQITRDEASGGWTATQDKPDGGITTQAETWPELLNMMADAQRLWDEDDGG